VAGRRPVVANALRTGAFAGRLGERSTAAWLRCLAVASLVLVAVAIVLEISQIGRLIAPLPAETAAIAILGLAGLAAVASNRAIMTLASRLEMLSWALDSAPDAQLIVAADDRIHYANRAFRDLLPGPAESPLDRVRQALCSD